jgi:uncharacterized membrane protein
MKITKCVPLPLIWDVLKIVVDILSPIVSACVFNQSCWHWLSYDALHVAITMALKLKEFKMTPSMANLMEDDMSMALEVSMFVFSVRKQACDVLNGFLHS